MSIRSTAKAIIIDRNKVLLNKCFDKYNGAYYSLPGGGQNTSETLFDAVIRECLEETGYTVSPKRFAALCEEICDNPQTKELYPEYIHKMYHIFICELVNDMRQNPTDIDDMQIGSEWVNIDNLDEIRILPNVLNNNLKTIIKNEVTLFLGSEHIQYNHG